MKKIFSYLFLSSLFLIAGKISLAQECTYYFPHKQGTEITMKSYNDKDKLTSTGVSKIVSVEGNTIKVESEVFDQKDKSMGKSTLSMSCQNGEFVVDMSNYLKGMNMDAYKDMEVKVETEDMHMPKSLKPGDVLDDGQITIKISNQGFQMMSMMVKVYNRKVEATEKITTPAGTFECAKITYDIDSKSIVSVSAKGVEWVTKDIGTVRSESYSSKGKLTGYTLLTSIK